MVWATGGALTIILMAALTMIVVVMVNGLGVFWPSAIARVTLADGSTFLGKRMDAATNPDTGIRSVQFKTGNREYAPQRQDFRWIAARAIVHEEYPPDVLVIERAENGDFYGELKGLATPTLDLPSDGGLGERFAAAIQTIRRERTEEVEPLVAELAVVSQKLQKMRDAALKAQYQAREAADSKPTSLSQFEAEQRELKQRSRELASEQQAVESRLRQNQVLLTDDAGKTRTVALVDIVRYYRPNAMSVPAKLGHYVAKIWELLTTDPRESNTEGGLFPMIFGTVMLIFLMAIFCFPLGVLAGIYLGEYAREGTLVRLVRIAVNNLAGIPSIVFGIFGLGFFIYFVGHAMDVWLYPERVAAGIPTFGTGGIFWAAMTLGLLTVPVVIVATEESLRTIPRGVRESSYALGSTKFQTLVRVLLPLASPGILTGFILAMARAAGEVAPLMITGVVKMAPSMPLDGQFPFFHLDRKFMHLGFHIYDIGFQSPNVEATKPMVYVTTLLLVLIVLVMSTSAIWLRNRLKKKLQIRTI